MIVYLHTEFINKLYVTIRVVLHPFFHKKPIIIFIFDFVPL